MTREANAESANPLARRYVIAWGLALLFYFLDLAKVNLFR
jgi:hypothetical protein